MEISLNKILKGYGSFRRKYVNSEKQVIQRLIHDDQKPEIMVVACCDSRVDPAIIFECDPGDLFVVRNIANIVPPYEKDNFHHGTSAALEFGINFLKVKHLVILGHSNCGGIRALMNKNFVENDFISNWVGILDNIACFGQGEEGCSVEECVKQSLHQSYKNCMTFPWIKQKVDVDELRIHRWYFDLQTGTVSAFQDGGYVRLKEDV